jgi:tRNA(fMet)-specific endonuclease VapC
MNYLLDTCVISELVARRANKSVLEWIDKTDEHMLNLSAVTIGEICRGIEKASDGERKTVLQAWLEAELLPRFHGRIRQLDTEVMITWGELTGKLDRAGTPMPAIDSLIAATALHFRLVLVTRNVSDSSAPISKCSILGSRCHKCGTHREPPSASRRDARVTAV